MKSVEHLLEFIKDKLSREEQIYLAAQIQVEIYKSQIEQPVSTTAFNQSTATNNNQTVHVESLIPVKSAQHLSEMPVAEHIGLFSSLDGKDIQYTFLLRKALTSRPKTLDKLRNFIITTCKGYGGLKDTDLDTVLNQLKVDKLFKIEDDGILIWNTN